MKTKARLRRFLAMLLVFAMLLSQANLTVFAADADEPVATVVENEPTSDPGSNATSDTGEDPDGSNNPADNTEAGNGGTVEVDIPTENEPTTTPDTIVPEGDDLSAETTPAPDQETEESDVTVYSDEPYNDVLTIVEPVGYVWTFFGEGRISDFNLPEGGVWASSDEAVVSMDAETGAMTIEAESGECQVTYTYIDENGVTKIALWNVKVGEEINTLGYEQYSKWTGYQRKDSAWTDIDLLGLKNGNDVIYVYCVERSVHFTPGASLEELDDTKIASENNWKLSAEKRNLIGYAMGYGWHDMNNRPQTTEGLNKYVATQLVIWNIIGNGVETGGTITKALTSKDLANPNFDAEDYSNYWNLQLRTDMVSQNALYKNYNQSVEAVKTEYKSILNKMHSVFVAPPDIFNSSERDGDGIVLKSSEISNGWKPDGTGVKFTKDGFSDWNSEVTVTSSVSAENATLSGKIVNGTLEVMATKIPSGTVTIQLKKNVDFTRYEFKLYAQSGSQDTIHATGETEQGFIKGVITLKPIAVTPTRWHPSVTKKVNPFEGTDCSTDTFDFTLNLSNADRTSDVSVPADMTVREVKNGETKSFPDITFNNVGTYTFKIQETSKSGYEVKYEPQEITVTVNINGEGKLVATADESDSTYKVTNTYKPQPVDWTWKVSKTVETDHYRPVDKKFTFTMKEDGSDSVKADPEEVKTFVVIPEGNGTGTYESEFEKVTFKQPGDYHFTISENDEADVNPGYTYDDRKYEVTVHVTDDHENGQLVKTVEVTENTGGAKINPDNPVFVFINKYAPLPTSVPLKATKTIDATENKGGYTYPKTAKFKFVLEKDLGSDGHFFSGEVLETKTLKMSPPVTGRGVSNTGQKYGEVVFKDLDFDRAGTYKYLILEERGDLDGFRYDSKIWEVTVEVEDNNGELKVASVTYKAKVGEEVLENKQAAEFTNKYNTEITSYTPQVFKAVAGAPMIKDTTFDFVIEEVVSDAEDGKKQIGKASVTIPKGETSGFASFPEIVYDQPGAHTYQIREVKPENAETDFRGYSFDETVWTLVVQVKDSGNVLKVTSVTYKAGDSENELGAEFINTYDVTETTYAPEVRKTISGTPTEDETFTFEISSEANEYVTMPESDTVTVVGAGTENFGDITFRRAGTYEFTITEQAGRNLNYTYDETSWTLTVVVEDHDSVLEVVSTTYTPDTPDVEASNDRAAFNNTYTEPEHIVYPATYTPNVIKTITGQPEESEVFNFTLTPNGSYGNDAIVFGTSTATVRGAGSASFGEIQFNAPGTYTYTITELAGQNLDYTYDETRWTLTVQVGEQEIDSEHTQLVVNSTSYTADTPGVEASNNAAAFNNTYMPEITPTPTPTTTIPETTPPLAETPSPEATPTPTEDIPEPTVPLANRPDSTPTPSRTVVTTIPQPNVPLAQMPGEEVETTEITDQVVPLGDAPKTGDETNVSLWLVIMAAALVGFAALTVPAYRRRRREDEE